MTQYEYFKWAVENGMNLERHWLTRTFTIAISDTEAGKHREPGDWWIADQKAYTTNATGEAEEITGFVFKEPLINYMELVPVKVGDFPLATEDLITGYSTLIFNLFFYHAFGDAIPYHNERFSGKQIDTVVAKALREDKITPKQLRLFSRCMSMSTVLCHAAVPSATKKGIMPIPGFKDYKVKLLKEYGDRLSDPVVLAEFEKKCLDFAKEWLEGDKIHEFRLKSKAFDVSMKRVHLVFGGEPTPDNPAKFDVSTESLLEGWDIESMPLYANSLRMGSYNRGALTALGGETAEFSARVFINSNIEVQDCGTKLYTPYPITSYSHGKFVGRTALVNGKETILEKGDTQQFIGKVVQLRSPNTCLAPQGNYCPTCLGRNVVESKIGLGIQASNPGQALLRAYLALMHGTKLSTEQYKLEGLH